LTAVAETGNGSVPSDWSLRQNYPNPFNSSTVLPFQAPISTADAALHIYNLQGQKVRTLVEGPVIAGYREISWDGQDQNGRIVASGVYLYRLKTGSIDLTRKLLFLR
ncbi:MAG: T9SS type A sorting domain-containing protein, partial [Gemmatimonadetes bacterium]|nr:T9SS type A sorting domain-containing protein [Gemmatimonadota bacterium]